MVAWHVCSFVFIQWRKSCKMTIPLQCNPTLKLKEVKMTMETNKPAGPWFNIKMSSYQYRKYHCGDKTVVRSSYLHNGISYSTKVGESTKVGGYSTNYFCSFFFCLSQYYLMLLIVCHVHVWQAAVTPAKYECDSKNLTHFFSCKCHQQRNYLKVFKYPHPQERGSRAILPACESWTIHRPHIYRRQDSSLKYTLGWSSAHHILQSKSNSEPAKPWN